MFTLLLLVTSACRKDLPALDGIDSKAWQLDKDGCNGYRAETAARLKTETEKLKGLSEMEIMTVLGTPDQNELYKRNQKFYTYFLEPSGVCASPANNPTRLVIRFNAMGLAKEVTTE